MGGRRLDPADLPRTVQQALINLKDALATLPDVTHAQVTFDYVACNDYPPTIDVRVLPI